METGIRLNAPPQRLNAPIVVARKYDTSEQSRLSASLMGNIRKVAGVDKTIADASFTVTLIDENRSVSGQSWEGAALTPYALTKGSAPSNKNQVVVSKSLIQHANLSVGSTVSLFVKGSPQSFAVVGIADASYDEPTVFFETSYALSVLPDNQVNAIGVIPKNNIDPHRLAIAIGAALPQNQYAVLVGDDRGIAEYPRMSGAQEVLIAGSAPFGGNTIVVVAFVISSILALSIRQRSREIALLQTLGATPRQVRRMLVTEAMLTALLAALLACVPGYFLGSWMFNALQSNGLIPEQVHFYTGFVPLVVGVGVSLLATYFASVLASRHATRIQPIEALADAAVQRRWFHWAKLVLGVFGLIGGLVLAFVTAIVMRGSLASSTAGPAVLPWLLMFGLLAPALVLPGVLLSMRVLRLDPRAGYLASKNIRVRLVQSASTITPIVLAVTMALSTLYQQTTLAAMTRKAYTKDIHADLIVRASGNGISLVSAQQINEIPGVIASSPLVVTEGRIIGKDGVPAEYPLRLQGITTQTSQGIFTYNVVAGSLQEMNPGTIALSQGTVNQLSSKVGDMVAIGLADGRTKTLRLAAVYTSPAGFESGLIDAQTALRHTKHGLVSDIAVRTTRSSDDFERSLAAIPALSQTQLVDGNTFSKDIDAQMSVLSWVNMLFTAMIALYAILFLVNIVAISSMSRRREFALQQLIGSTRRQILSMVALESAALTATASVLGVLLSTVSLVPFSIAINGTPFPNGSWWILIGVLSAAFILHVGVTLLITTLALRGQPIKVAANRE